MAFVRTFLVNIIPNEITIEQFCDSMEYLGSICRIDKTPYLSDDTKTPIGWNAYVYYESWKSTEATRLIDQHLANPRRRNVLCFIDPSGKTKTGTIDTELNTPTITVYSLLYLDVQPQFWLLCRNTSNHYKFIPEDDVNAYKLIRFIPKNYHLIVTIPTKRDGSFYNDDYILNKIQHLKLGNIAYIKKSNVLYDQTEVDLNHNAIVTVYLKKWNISEFTMILQERIAKHNKAELMMEFGEPNWIVSPLYDDYDDLSIVYFPIEKYESWVRPNQHLYFDE